MSSSGTLELAGSDLTAQLARVAPNTSPASRARIERATAALLDIEHSGPTLGRYRLEGMLGYGGFGIVYRAHDPALRRPVAIKLLQVGHLHRSQRDALLDEARDLARISHPHVVQILDVGRANDPEAGQDEDFIVMELIEGSTLGAWLEQHGRSIPQILELFRQAAQGLAHIHAAGLVHGDVKPANMLIDTQGRVKLIDLGCAARPCEPTRRLTPGGTPRYMAPEQHVDRPVSAAADQYAWALSLLEVLLGHHPLGSAPSAGYGEAKRRGIVVPSSASRAWPPGLVDVLHRALHLDPLERFSSFEELLAALPRARARRRRRLAGLGAGLGALTLGLVELLPSSPPAHARMSPTCELARAAVERLSQADLEHAAATPGVLDRLVSYRSEWVTLEQRACGHEPGAESDGTERFECFERRFAELQRLEPWLTTPDDAPQGLERLLQILSSPRVCDRPAPTVGSSTSDDVERSPEPDPERSRLRDKLVAQQEEFAEGDYRALLTRAQAVRAEIEQFGEPKLLADALYWEGGLQSVLGKHRDAIASQERTYEIAMSVGYERIAAASAGVLSSMMWSVDHDSDKAWTWLHHAEAILARSRTPNPMLTVELKIRRGQLCYDDQRLLCARKAFAEAIAEYERIGTELTAYTLAESLMGLGNVEHELGELDAARRHLERARDVMLADLGPQSSRIGLAVGNLAQVELTAGDATRAIALGQEALILLEGGLGAEHAHVLEVRVELGWALAADGRHEEAASMFREAVELAERLHGRDAVEGVSPRLGLGQASCLRGQLGSGRARIREAARILARMEDPRPRDTEKLHESQRSCGLSSS